MEEIILKLGAIAGAVSAVTALQWKPCKSMRDRRRQDKADLAAYREKVAKALDRLEKKMDSEEEDIAYLQRYELKQAHATLTQRGWCSSEEKAAVLDLYDHYSGERHRNSLIDSYRKNIDGLPAHPVQGGEH